MGNPKVCGSLEIAYLIYYLHRQAKGRVTHRLNINIKKFFCVNTGHQLLALPLVNTTGVCGIGPVAQPWRRLSPPKSRSRRSWNGDRWAAIACIAQLGSATAVAGWRQLSRNGDSRRGTATAVAERRQPSPRRQPSRKGYEDHQST